MQNYGPHSGKCHKIFVVYFSVCCLNLFLKTFFDLWNYGHGFHNIFGIMGRIFSNMGGIMGPDFELKWQVPIQN